jgi:hypothetical protein
LIPITIIISPNFVDQQGVYTSLGEFTLTFTGVDSTQTFSLPVPDNSAWQPANHLAVLALPTRDVINLFYGAIRVQYASALITENDESLAPASAEERQAAMTRAYEANDSAGRLAYLTHTFYYNSGYFGALLSVADTSLFVNNRWGFAPFDESAYYLTLPDTAFITDSSPGPTPPPAPTPPPNSSTPTNSSPPNPETIVIPPTNNGSNNSSPPIPDPLISTPPASGGSSSGGYSSGDPGTYSSGNNSSPPMSSNSSSASNNSTSNTSGSNTNSNSSGSSPSSTWDPLTSGIWNSITSSGSPTTNPLLV